MKTMTTNLVISFAALALCGESSAEATKSVRLVLPSQPGPVVENSGKVFTRQVMQRCEAKVVMAGAAPFTVELAVEKGIGAEGYRIEDRKDGGVRIAGNDERGLVAGVGKFLRTSRYDKGGFTPGTWRGTSVPQKPVRGIYFWFFNADEWQGLGKAFTDKKPFADYILTEDAARPMPAKLPMVGFPKISMHETFPWGGFGATPLTRRAEQQWNAVKKASSGGFPYSEGIYEDMTKAVIAQLYWNDRPAEETVREYAAFEYSPDAVDEIVQVVKTLEQNHHMRWWPGKLEGVKLQLDWFPSRGAKPREDPGAEAAYATVQRVDARLSPQARKAWRWRQLYLRALLDSELKTHGGTPNDLCNEAFAELIAIYHAEKADPAVRPPLPAVASKNPSSPNSGAAKSPPRDPTTVASSEFSADCHAGMACDGVRASQDENNFWASANRQDVGAWWRKDLGNRHSIEKIRIQFRGFGGHYHFVPKTITFQVSDDGNAWTTAVSKSADVPANNSPYAATMHTYDINAKGRYVRLLFEDGTDDEVGNSKVVELVEVEVVRAGSAPVGNK